MQVGGSCVRIYFGWSPTMPRLDLLLCLNEFLNYPVGRPEASDTLTVLAVAHDIVAQHGYLPVSSAEYYEIPTSERVKDALASSGYRCEIGRASCRERVEAPGAGAHGKNEERAQVGSRAR